MINIATPNASEEVQPAKTPFRYLYRSTKPKFCYHIATEQGTACKMQNCSSYSRLDKSTDAPPPGRKLCSICARLSGVPVPPVEPTPTPSPPPVTPASYDKLLAHFGVAMKKHTPGWKEAGIHLCQEIYQKLGGPLPSSLSWQAARSALGTLKKTGKLPPHPGLKKTKWGGEKIGSATYQSLAQASRERQAAESARLQSQREASREAKAKQQQAKKAKPKKIKPPKTKRTSLLSPERIAFIISDAFLDSREWRAVRYDALKKNNGCCELCGMSKKDGIVLNVDHIKPRRRYPELALDPKWLQVLCGPCNHGKGNRDETDWR